MYYRLLLSMPMTTRSECCCLPTHIRDALAHNPKAGKILSASQLSIHVVKVDASNARRFSHGPNLSCGVANTRSGTLNDVCPVAKRHMREVRDIIPLSIPYKHGKRMGRLRFQAIASVSQVIPAPKPRMGGPGKLNLNPDHEPPLKHLPDLAGSMSHSADRNMTDRLP